MKPDGKLDPEDRKVVWFIPVAILICIVCVASMLAIKFGYFG